MVEYAARICWNSQNWVYPTREAAKLEKGTFVEKNKFGFEEWLFNLAWIIDGYHYGFLEPVHKSFEKYTGETIDIILYTIPARNQKLFIGKIRNCEVLTRKDASHALKVYRKNRWLKEMQNQVIRIGGNKRKLMDVNFSILNIRFLPENLEICQPYKQISRRDPIYKLTRYLLCNLSGKKSSKKRKRRASTSPKSTTPIVRSGMDPTVSDPIHNIMQNELAELLRNQFGEKAVAVEEDNVDIKVRTPKRFIYIEIKSEPDAKMAIRGALGQLLEYALYKQGKIQKIPALYIVAQGPVTTDIKNYIRMLRGKFGVPVQYRNYIRGSRTFKI